MPISAATATMAGNGTANAKIATKAAAAILHSHALRSAREPMRHAADTTMAVTAGLMPYSTPATAGTWPKRA